MASTASNLLHDLADHARSLVRGAERVLLGIAGAPGSGKTALADAVARTLRNEVDDLPSEYVARLPMDGFHLADAELKRLALLERKGSPETFDVGGCAALLRRLRKDRTTPVHAPAFRRDIEQPIAGSICIQPKTRLIITEGNYLLSGGEWRCTAPLLDQVWFVESNPEQRVQRLIARHVLYDKSAQEARHFVESVDRRNAELVTATRLRADLVITVNDQSVFQAASSP